MKILLTWTILGVSLTLAGFSNGFVHSFRRLKPTHYDYEVILYHNLWIDRIDKSIVQQTLCRFRKISKHLLIMLNSTRICEFHWNFEKSSVKTIVQHALMTISANFGWCARQCRILPILGTFCQNKKKQKNKKTKKIVTCGSRAHTNIYAATYSHIQIYFLYT